MKSFFCVLLLAFLAGCASTPPPPASTAPAAPKATFVIVHGAWGGGYAFKEVDNYLTADGYKVYRPTLTGLGEKVHLATPDTDLDTHINDIVNVIEWEDLHDVVLVGHSYGGMVITGVADRIPQRIKCLIYLDAFLPVDGESVNTAAGGHATGLEISTDANGFLLYPGFNTSTQPIPHDVPMPPKAFSQPISLKNQDIAKNIPSTYVMFLSDGQTLSQGRFYLFYQRAQARGWNLRTLTSDHNAQVSHPQQLAALLENVLAPKSKPDRADDFPDEPDKPRPEGHPRRADPINE
jgi:pimeloyl-ACP methyl ester carboxylesterase